jgi:GT2 family glycosyltransferase
LIKDSGLFNEDFKVLEDWEFWLRLSKHSDFYHIKKPTVVVNWKDDGTTLTSSRQKEFRVFHERINKMYFSEIKNIKDSQEIISEFQIIWMNDLITKPVVSIIVPTFNQLNFSRECFESIYSYTKIPFELIVIINNKSDGTIEYLQQLSKVHNNIRILTNDENQGFPVSINQGINVSVSEFVLIINNDIVVTEDWLESLLDVANKNESVGIVGPISNEVSGVQKDKEANYKSIDEMHLYAASIREKNKNKITQFPRVAFLCTLIKKEVIDKIGGLDERFSPGNFEDDDFCLRAQLAGFNTVIANDVFIHHYGSKSFKADGERKYAERLKINHKIFVDKWGADPDEIWLKGKPFNQQRSLYISIDSDEFVKSFERAQKNIEDKEYGLAFAQLQKACLEFENSSKSISIISKEELTILTANIALINNEFENAKQYFEETLKLNPTSSEACFGLGQVFYQEEMFEQSKTMLEWAIKNDPQNQKAAEGLKAVNEILSLPAEHNSLIVNELVTTN